MTPTSPIADRNICIGDWCPSNYEGERFGKLNLTSAFEHSVNTAAVAISIKTGRQPIADLAHKMGITSDFPVTRSLALGVAEVSVIDMTSAYSVFASGGYKTPAFGILKISTRRGDEIYSRDLTAPRERILTDKTVGYMDTLMRAVVTGGTGTRAAIDGVPAVGKTGTTSDYRDAWFCGFTGNYVAAVWYGNDDYHQTNTLTGGLLPAMTWQKFMAYAHTNIEVKPIPFLDSSRARSSSPPPMPTAPIRQNRSGHRHLSRKRRASCSISPTSWTPPSRPPAPTIPTSPPSPSPLPETANPLRFLLNLLLMLVVALALGFGLSYYALSDGRLVGAAQIGPWTAWPRAGSPAPIPTRGPIWHGTALYSWARARACSSLPPPTAMASRSTATVATGSTAIRRRRPSGLWFQLRRTARPSLARMARGASRAPASPAPATARCSSM